jgi:hypothetical protein
MKYATEDTNLAWDSQALAAWGSQDTHPFLGGQRDSSSSHFHSASSARRNSAGVVGQQGDGGVVAWVGHGDP